MKKIVCIFLAVCLSSTAATSWAQSQDQSAIQQQGLQQLKARLETLQQMSKTQGNQSSQQLLEAARQQTDALQKQQTIGTTTSASDGVGDGVQTDGRASMAAQAFTNMVTNQLPLTPEQIDILHKAFDEVQRVASKPPNIPAKPTTSAVLVNLSPSATPPVIRLGAGYITSVVFVDSTGQPWPIQAYSVGDPSSYNIQWDQKGNTLLVQATSYYKRSNMAVLLRGLDTPVMLTLLPGQTAVDYRVDLRVSGLGPNALLMQEGLPTVGDPAMLDVLNGVPPKNARMLKVLGVDNCQAWLMNNILYLRTSLDVISPAWQSVMTSVDGTHAYKLQPASVILALQHGKDKIIKLVLQGIK